MKNKIFSQSIIYSLSTVINKGLVLIALPFLGSLLSIEDYGIWSLVQTIITLGIPFISLNSYASILREGVISSNNGFFLLKKYWQITFAITILLITSVYFLNPYWLQFAILLIIIEAFQYGLLGWFRSQDKHFKYFIISVFKLTSLLIAIFIMRKSPNLYYLFFYQSIIYAILLFPVVVITFIKNKGDSKIDFKPMLIFSVLLIPHSLAQWVLSASDKLIIKYYLTDTELGIYSLSYSLAFVLMIVNSGLGLTLPSYIINNYQKWIIGNFRIKVLFIYGIIILCVSSFVIFVIPYFSNYIPLLKEITKEDIKLISILMYGLFLLGAYYFYINILFYHKKAKIISMITTSVAIFNVIATIVLVNKIGVFGAGIATFVSYVIYTIIALIFAVKIERKLLKTIKYDIGIIISFLGLQILILTFLTR